MRTLPLLILPLLALGCSGTGDGDGDCTDTTCDTVGDDDDTSPGDDDDDILTGDDDDDDVVYTGCLADGIDVEPGTGIDGYVGIDDGDDMIMVHGPQGGWHIDVGGVVTHTEQLVQIDAVFTDTETGAQVAGDQTGVRQALVGWDEMSCSGEFYGVRVFLDDLSANVTQDDICGLEGANLEMTLTVTALEAEPPAIAEVTLPVIAVLDPADVPICAGTAR